MTFVIADVKNPGRLPGGKTDYGPFAEVRNCNHGMS